MRAPFLAAVISLLFLAPAPSAAAEVIVEFVDPQSYTDTGGYGVDAERNLAALKRHLQTEGRRCVASDETLALRVLDVDLAGRQEWWHPHSGGDLRVMREITWPRLEVAYVRRNAAGASIQEGRERISDMSYLWRSAYVRNDTGPLPYERAMLKDWFERRFCRDAH
ncbi:hypothetical protein CJ010_09785 [Azoarcus sp. DD4]|uniref:DUF3016 domain-containing protein n=1 Tax=Azoarcus sp. DD4 TaxID=2027405 RepID=UPI00112CF7CF|nr:DUF3016 domain-containing protein [Azoarcus sp. DD4]QDF96798.1 hypothetical protein CJ010_09785 [Azoarcus sp. DD4]